MEMTVAKNEEAAEDAAERVSVKISDRLGIRHLQVVLLFFGMIIGYCLRVSMSEAVVAMSNSSTANPEFEDFGWNAKERSQILSAFFWGYTAVQVPSGYIAGIWSGHKLLSLGMTFCGVFHCLTPVAAHFGNLMAVCACRVGMGLTQGCLLPCIHTLLSKWAPPDERARLGTFAYAGGHLGTVITFPISGVLAASSVGWPSIFYVFGALAITWGVAFFVYGADSPATHSRISERERRYIEDSLKTVREMEGQTSKGKPKVPWKQIFTSPPMWALIIVHCGQNWGFWTLLTEMPSYMSDVLKFNITTNGMVAALPYLTLWILSFPVSWLSDYFLKKGVSRAVIRKVCNTIAHWGPAIALICMGFVPSTNTTVVVAILVIAVGLNAGSICGFQINHIDLSPNFAGTLMSITNCAASVIAIVAPLICGEIVTKETDVTQWHTVFYISALFYFVGNLVFILYGKGEVQWWNDMEAERNESESEKNKKKSNV